MNTWWVIVGCVSGVVALTAVIALSAMRRRDKLSQLVRLVPLCVALLRDVMTDKTLPRKVRLVPVLAVVYLSFPIDLVPDFIPVLGYLDDAIVVVWTLRYLVSSVGRDRIAGHWKGDQATLQSILRLAGVP